MNTDCPRDVVPPTASTRDTLLRMNAMVGEIVTVLNPGEIVEDVDGFPIGMTENTVTRAPFAGAVVTPAHLASVGLTPQDVPNLTIINPGETDA